MKLFTLLLFFSIFSFASEDYAKSHSINPAETVYDIKRTVSYTYLLKNESAKLLKEVDFKIYAPVSRTSYQLSTKLTSNLPSRLIKDNFGNQILHFKLVTIAPYATTIVTVKAELLMSSLAQKVTLEVSPFLKPERYIESTDPAISAVAVGFQKQEAAALAAEIFAWTTKNIAKGSYTAENRGALRALADKSGDCSEQAFLFTALCRNKQIPTAYISGFYTIKNTRLKAHNFHNWAMFYDKEHWYVADPQAKIFKEKSSNFIAFTIHGGDSQQTMQNNHRYLVSGSGTENLKVSMK